MKISVSMRISEEKENNGKIILNSVGRSVSQPFAQRRAVLSSAFSTAPARTGRLRLESRGLRRIDRTGAIGSNARFADLM